jgi:quercetin dioxygenase-like cupin family protein
MNISISDVGSSSSASSRVFVRRSPGVEICVLRIHPDGGLTFLVRMAKGGRAERHGHPGGEETYVLSGKLRIDRRIGADEQPRPDVVLDAGDHVFAPPGEAHEGYAEEDTTFLVVAPGGIARSSDFALKGNG